MAKYSTEFKRKVVMEYLAGLAGYDALAKIHGVSYSQVRRWVINYRHFGEKSLERCERGQDYAFEFKLHVVELYLTGKYSYQDLALRFDMRTPSQIAKWVMDYRTAGPDALIPRSKDRRRIMDREKVIREIEENGSEEQKALLKQLQEENLRLRIQNAFLKELRRLRLEEEALLNEQQGSSTASEENSD